MAFEAYLTQDQARPTHRRRLTYTLSLLVHGALVAVGVVYSFWHVEELSPPTVRVTFLSAATPPPPPPPPPAGGGAPKKKAPIKAKPTVTPTVVQPRNNIVQPRERALTEPVKKDPPPVDPKQKNDDDDDALPGGVAGGSKGGTVGGTIGGTVGGTVGGAVAAAPVAPKFLAPQMGAMQKLSGQQPVFPAVLRKPGASYLVIAKICVDRDGAVEGVTIMKKGDPLLDSNVASAVKDWRHRPWTANNTPVPFCYIVNFEFKSE